MPTIAPMRRQPVMAPGLDLAPQGYPAPMAFDAPPPVDQQADEDLQGLGGLAAALQQKLAPLATPGIIGGQPITDAPLKRPRQPFPNPHQADILAAAMGGGGYA